MNIIDKLVFAKDYRYGALVSTVDARELHIMRGGASRWNQVHAAIQTAYKIAQDHPLCAGPVKIALYVARDIPPAEGEPVNIVPTQFVQQIELHEDLLKWP